MPGILGAGHNGLVAAAYLARAGLSVLLLEKNNYIGGATTSQKLFQEYDADLLALVLPGQLIPRENHSRSWLETRAAPTCDQVVHAGREEWSPGWLALEQRFRGDKPSINLRADRKLRGGGAAQAILRFDPGFC